MELEMSLPLWLSTLSQYKIRDTFCSYSVMELCTKGLGTQTEALKVSEQNLIRSKFSKNTNKMKFYLNQ